MMFRVTSRRVVLVATAIATTFAATGFGTAARAAPGDIIVTYDTVGSAHVKRTNLTVPLKKSLITADITPSGSLTADLPIPSTRVSFKAFGYLPVAATVSFVQVGDATGQLSTFESGRSSVQATARYVIQLRDVLVGYTKANVGPFCQTVDPITLDIATPESDKSGFNVVDGGTLEGVFSIGKFKNCGTSTDLANIVVPGPDNTVTVELSNGQFSVAEAARLHR